MVQCAVSVGDVVLTCSDADQAAVVLAPSRRAAVGRGEARATSGDVVPVAAGAARSQCGAEDQAVDLPACGDVDHIAADPARSPGVVADEVLACKVAGRGVEDEGRLRCVAAAQDAVQRQCKVVAPVAVVAVPSPHVAVVQYPVLTACVAVGPDEARSRCVAVSKVVAAPGVVRRRCGGEARVATVKPVTSGPIDVSKVHRCHETAGPIGVRRERRIEDRAAAGAVLPLHAGEVVPASEAAAQNAAAELRRREVVTEVAVVVREVAIRIAVEQTVTIAEPILLRQTPPRLPQLRRPRLQHPPLPT